MSRLYGRSTSELALNISILASILVGSLAVAYLISLHFLRTIFNLSYMQCVFPDFSITNNTSHHLFPPLLQSFFHQLKQELVVNFLPIPDHRPKNKLSYAYSATNTLIDFGLNKNTPGPAITLCLVGASRVSASTTNAMPRCSNSGTVTVLVVILNATDLVRIP